MTRLPVARLVPAPWPEREQGRSALWYPAVGLVLAAVLVLVHAALPVALSPLLQAAIIVSAWTALTGALHLDGLADAADAWFAGHGAPDNTLAVFKDPAAGPMGVTALVLVLLLKTAALAELGPDVATALLLSLLLARTAVLVFMLVTPYSRAQGLGALLRRHLPATAVWALAAAAIAATLWWLPVIVAIVTVMLLAALIWWWRRLWLRRIGGFTGDCAGALIELSETAVLVVLGVYAAL